MHCACPFAYFHVHNLLNCAVPQTQCSVKKMLNQEKSESRRAFSLLRGSSIISYRLCPKNNRYNKECVLPAPAHAGLVHTSGTDVTCISACRPGAMSSGASGDRSCSRRNQNRFFPSKTCVTTSQETVPYHQGHQGTHLAGGEHKKTRDGTSRETWTWWMAVLALRIR
eukprot:861121-Pelagomonas_calceolata.AAC.3